MAILGECRGFGAETSGAGDVEECNFEDRCRVGHGWEYGNQGWGFQIESVWWQDGNEIERGYCMLQRGL